MSDTPETDNQLVDMSSSDVKVYTKSVRADVNGETIYSFSTDFEDTWGQETQNTYGE